ncbi:MAG: 50S ribosomal protein L10 [Candidatus Dojkabacteria bacterium]|nr:50S ribosomal protein L10 [Candidatus Dojkabacteria bacterium]
MSKSKSQKNELLNKYKDIIKSKEGYFLINSDNVDTATITGLKIQLKDASANLSVVKNSIFKVALQETEQPLQTQEFDGPTAIIYFDEDPTTPAKLLKEKSKENKKLEILSPRSGVYKGEFLTAEKVMQLADIPSREVLLGKLLGTMSAPLSGFMNAVTGNIRGLTMVLKGISEKSA